MLPTKHPASRRNHRRSHWLRHRSRMPASMQRGRVLRGRHGGVPSNVHCQAAMSVPRDREDVQGHWDCMHGKLQRVPRHSIRLLLLLHGAGWKAASFHQCPSAVQGGWRTDWMRQGNRPKPNALLLHRLQRFKWRRRRCLVLRLGVLL